MPCLHCNATTENYKTNLYFRNRIFLGYSKLINETQMDATKSTQIDVYAEQLATQTLMSSKDLMISTIYINSLIKRVEKKFFHRNSEIRMIPITQNDNDNMIKLMIDIEIKLTKDAKRLKKLKTSLKQKRELYKIRSKICWNRIKKLLCCCA